MFALVVGDREITQLRGLLSVSELWLVCVPGSELKSDQRLRVLSGGRQLQISSTERTDTASYTCTASSAAGTTSKEYTLQVYGRCISA